MDEKALPPASLTDPLLCDLRPPRCGDICPNCGQGKLDYNGLLELECLACGYRNGGDAGGCT